MKIHSRNVQTTTGTMPKVRVSGNGMGAGAMPLNGPNASPAMPKIVQSSGSLGTDSVGPNKKK